MHCNYTAAPPSASSTVVLHCNHTVIHCNYTAAPPSTLRRHGILTKTCIRTFNKRKTRCKKRTFVTQSERPARRRTCRSRPLARRTTNPRARRNCTCPRAPQTNKETRRQRMNTMNSTLNTRHTFVLLRKMNRDDDAV